jgi:hypothetical protein
MRHQYVGWAAAAAVGAAIAMVGCAGSKNSGVNGAAGASVGQPVGGTTAMPVGTGGTTTTPPSSSTGGTGPAMTTAGTGGGVGTAGSQGPAGMGAATGGVGGTTMTTGGTGGSAAGTGGTMAMAGMGSCGPENTNSPVDLGDPMKLGPWMPKHDQATGPDGQSWIFYPDGLGMGGLKHPVFNWGPGAGTGPDSYVDHLNLLASQGFVVISQASTASGKAALDWILKENETSGSKWYQKLDPMRVSRGGHSMGALQSMSEAADPRLKLTVLVCGGASGSGGADKINYPSIFLGGENEGGTTNFAGDYAQVTGLSIFVTKTSTDHIYCARNNLAPWVAFMRWQLCGEDKYKKEFMPDGTYCKAPWLACMTKNL